MTEQTRGTTRWWLALVVLCSCIGCDQATKGIATRTLQNAPPRSYLGDTVRLQFALNPGGFLSLGADLPEKWRQTVFVGIGGLMMAAVVAFLILRQEASVVEVTSATLILAGGIGNLIDRIVNDGLVTDFLNLGIGPVRTGVFNVADMALMAGAFGMVWLWHGPPGNETPPEKPNPAETGERP